jgi:citrate lyase alpha subunit
MSFPSDFVRQIAQYQWITIDSIDGGCEFDPGNNAWIQLPVDPKTVVARHARKLTVHATFHNHKASPVQNGFSRAYLNNKRVLNDKYFDGAVGAYASGGITFTFDAIADDDTSNHYLNVSVWSSSAILSLKPYQLASVTAVYGVRVYV